MFQRVLLRQGQVARSVLSSSRPFSTAPSAIRRPSQLLPQFSQVARPLIRQPAGRCYSTEKESNGENKNAEATEGEASAESETPEDPIRKELEEKKKEAAEMKVS